MNYDTIRCSGRSYFTGPATFNSKATCFDKLYLQNKTETQSETYLAKTTGQISIFSAGIKCMDINDSSISSHRRHYFNGGVTWTGTAGFNNQSASTFLGLNMNNSDIFGCGAILFDDDSAAADRTEGLLFAKTGKVKSFAVADYWNLKVNGAGELLLNEKVIANSAGSTFSAEYKADLGETIPKSDNTEDIPVGYIVKSNNDKYTKSNKAYDPRVVGVVSDTYGHLLNGKPKDSDIVIALAGRVPVYIKGTIEEGECIVASEIPGIGMRMDKFIPGTIIGKAVESKTTEEVGLVKMLVSIS